VSVNATIEDGVGILAFDRPDKRNALRPEMLDAFTASVGTLESGGARALLVTGRGKIFCSGFDLKLCLADPEGGVMRSLLTGLDAAIRALRESPLPVVLAAHGAALAGGCALLGGADIVVTHTDAKLGYPVVKIGVSPAVSGPFLGAQAGAGYARSRLLDPGLTTGAEAFERGLAQELVDSAEEVVPRATEIAASLASKPAWAIAATKAWLNECAAPPPGADGLAASLSLTGGDEERELLARAFRSKDTDA